MSRFFAWFVGFKLHPKLHGVTCIHERGITLCLEFWNNPSSYDLLLYVSRGRTWRGTCVVYACTWKKNRSRNVTRLIIRSSLKRTSLIASTVPSPVAHVAVTSNPYLNITLHNMYCSVLCGEILFRSCHFNEEDHSIEKVLIVYIYIYSRMKIF